MKNRWIILILLLFSCGCQLNRKISAIDFLEKYGSDSFLEFRNYSFILRGYNNNKNEPIVGVYDESFSDSSGCHLPFRAIIDVRANQIKDTSRTTLNDTCKINEQLSCQLALKFIKYNVVYLCVDSIGSVFVKYGTEGKYYDLARFSMTKYIPSKGWKSIGKNNWFEKIEDLK